MTNSMWQQTEEMAKKHDQGGSLWLKLAGDGDKAVVVFLGEPHPREVAFVDGKYVEVDEKMKAAGTKASLRVALNVALYDSKEVKVLEQGVMFFKDLVRVREKYGLEKWAFEIQRHGAAKDPKTTYSILPEHQLSVEQQKAFQALPQHDLATRQMRGFGAMLAFSVADAESAVRVLRATRLCRNAVSLGGPETLITHPASLVFAHQAPDELAASGVDPATLRLSVGLEEPEDIIADLAQALSTVDR